LTYSFRIMLYFTVSIYGSAIPVY